MEDNLFKVILPTAECLAWALPEPMVLSPQAHLTFFDALFMSDLVWSIKEWPVGERYIQLSSGRCSGDGALYPECPDRTRPRGYRHVYDLVLERKGCAKDDRE